MGRTLRATPQKPTRDHPGNNRLSLRRTLFSGAESPKAASFSCWIICRSIILIEPPKNRSANLLQAAFIHSSSLTTGL